MISSNDLLGATMSFLGFPNGLLARLGSTSHPSSHIIIFRQPPVVRGPAAHAAQHHNLPPACPSRIHHHPLPLPAPRGRLGSGLLRPPPPARPRPRARPCALRPAHWPLGCGSSGSSVLLALLARLPLGLHVALDLSPIDLRFSATRITPKRRGSGARAAGRVRPFRIVYGPQAEFPNSKSLLLSGPQLFNFRVKTFGALR